MATITFPTVCAMRVRAPTNLSCEEVAVWCAAHYSTKEEACVVRAMTAPYVDLVRLRRSNWRRVLELLQEHRVDTFVMRLDEDATQVRLQLSVEPDVKEASERVIKTSILSVMSSSCTP